jgi:hypothetical protein
MGGNHVFICDATVEQVNNLAREILGDSFVIINVISMKFLENFETNKAELESQLIELTDNNVKTKQIYGQGVGLIDACFDALIKCYEKTYCSLDTISIVDFRINSHTEQANRRQSDAKVTALLRVNNSLNHEYTFECTSSSISHSSMAAVQESVAFFINSELAYTRLHYALKDAEKRGRGDLVERFKQNMGTLVNATSYEKVVKRLKVY